jgi:hypothetical protein
MFKKKSSMGFCFPLIFFDTANSVIRATKAFYDFRCHSLTGNNRKEQLPLVYLQKDNANFCLLAEMGKTEVGFPSANVPIYAINTITVHEYFKDR